MKYINLGKTGMKTSEIALGCMRLTELDEKEASELVHTALELGINFFDHADCYGEGTCEEIFAQAIGMNLKFVKISLFRRSADCMKTIMTFL